MISGISIFEIEDNTVHVHGFSSVEQAKTFSGVIASSGGIPHSIPRGRSNAVSVPCINQRKSAMKQIDIGDRRSYDRNCWSNCKKSSHRAL